MSLPRVGGGACSLVRLGETHQSVCHPERETALTNMLPPVNASRGVRSLVLRLKTLRLNPFPDELDELIYSPAAMSHLVTLRYSQKYFLPAASVVEM